MAIRYLGYGISYSIPHPSHPARQIRATFCIRFDATRPTLTPRPHPHDHHLRTQLPPAPSRRREPPCAPHPILPSPLQRNCRRRAAPISAPSRRFGLQSRPQSWRRCRSTLSAAPPLPAVRASPHASPIPAPHHPHPGVHRPSVGDHRAPNPSAAPPSSRDSAPIPATSRRSVLQSRPNSGAQLFLRRRHSLPAALPHPPIPAPHHPHPGVPLPPVGDPRALPAKRYAADSDPRRRPSAAAPPLPAAGASSPPIPALSRQSTARPAPAASCTIRTSALASVSRGTSACCNFLRFGPHRRPSNEAELLFPAASGFQKVISEIQSRDAGHGSASGPSPTRSRATSR